MTESSKDLTKDTATESFKFPSIDNYPVQAPHYAIGAFVISGGLFAFYKKKSVGSLVGSFALGSVLLGSGMLLQHGQHVAGHAAAGVGSTALCVLGFHRFYVNRKIMPALPMVLIGHFFATQSWFDMDRVENMAVKVAQDKAPDTADEVQLDKDKGQHATDKSSS